jgi:hypothetical protein
MGYVINIQTAGYNGECTVGLVYSNDKYRCLVLVLAEEIS